MSKDPFNIESDSPPAVGLEGIAVAIGIGVAVAALIVKLISMMSSRLGKGKGQQLNEIAKRCGEKWQLVKDIPSPSPATQMPDRQDVSEPLRAYVLATDDITTSTLWGDYVLRMHQPKLCPDINTFKHALATIKSAAQHAETPLTVIATLYYQIPSTMVYFANNIAADRVIMLRVKQEIKKLDKELNDAIHQLSTSTTPSLDEATKIAALADALVTEFGKCSFTKNGGTDGLAKAEASWLDVSETMHLYGKGATDLKAAIKSNTKFSDMLYKGTLVSLDFSELVITSKEAESSLLVKNKNANANTLDKLKEPTESQKSQIKEIKSCITKFGKAYKLLDQAIDKTAQFYSIYESILNTNLKVSK